MTNLNFKICFLIVFRSGTLCRESTGPVLLTMTPFVLAENLTDVAFFFPYSNPAITNIPTSTSPSLHATITRPSPPLYVIPILPLGFEARIRTAVAVSMKVSSDLAVMQNHEAWTDWMWKGGRARTRGRQCHQRRWGGRQGKGWWQGASNKDHNKRPTIADSQGPFLGVGRSRVATTATAGASGCYWQCHGVPIA